MGALSSKEQAQEQAQELTETNRTYEDDDDHDSDETGRAAARKMTDGVYRFEIKSERSCTDCLWLLLFLLFWVGMLVIAGVAASKGNPDRLIYATDWNGTVCNTGDMAGKPYIYYPELSKDLETAGGAFTGGDAEAYAFATRGICVAACPLRFEEGPKQRTLELPWSKKSFAVPYNTKNVFYRCLDDFHYYEADVAQCLYFKSDDAGTVTTGCSTGAVVKKDCVAKPCSKYQESGLPGAANATCTRDGEFAILPCEQGKLSDPEHFAKCNDTVAEQYPHCTEIAMGSATLTNQPKTDNPIYQSMMRWGATIARWVGDLQLAAPAILVCGCIFAVAMGFLWIFLVQWVTTLVVWATVILSLGMMLALSLYCLAKGDVITSSYVSAAEGGRVLPPAAGYALGSHAAAAKSTTEIWAICGWICVGLFALMVLVLCYLRTRIRLAIGMITEAGRAVRDMPLMMFFPLVPVMMLCALIVYWLWVAANLASIDGVDFHEAAAAAAGGDATDTNVSPEDTYRYLLLYHFFGLLWTNQFIAGLQLMTVAGAVSRWYWRKPEEDINGTGGCCSPDTFVSPTFNAFKRALRYHMGSIAFGSLIIALVQMLRMAFEYFIERTKALQGESCVVRIVTACVRCLLWCLERCFKYITWNVYILIAMQGCNFCAGTKEAFKLISSNVKRIVTVQVMSAFVINLGRCMIVVTCTLAMFGLMEGDHFGAIFMASGVTSGLGAISSPVFPLLAVIVFSSVVADQFMDVFYMAIETIMLSFCSDVSMNGESKRYAMSDDLRTFMNGDAKNLAFMHVNHVSDGAGHWKTVDEEEEKREF